MLYSDVITLNLTLPGQSDFAAHARIPSTLGQDIHNSRSFSILVILKILLGPSYRLVVLPSVYLWILLNRKASFKTLSDCFKPTFLAEEFDRNIYSICQAISPINISTIEGIEESLDRLRRITKAQADPSSYRPPRPERLNNDVERKCWYAAIHQ